MRSSVLSNPLAPDLYGSGDPRTGGLPLDLYDVLRDNMPCYRQELDEEGFIDWTWVVSRYDDVVMVDTDAVRFRSTEGTSVRAFEPTLPKHGGKPSMLTLDGDEHYRNRLIVSRGFTPRSIKALEASLRTIAVEVVDNALQDETFDFVERVARQLPMRAICDLLGVPDADRQALVHWSDTIASPTDPVLTPSLEDMLFAVNAVCDYALTLADRRRSDPADDLMTKVVAARESDTLDDDELMGMMLLLAVAGNETTRNAISHGLNAFIQHPDQWQDLRERTDDVVDTAVEEILRIACPVVGFTRRVAVDVEIHGQHIEAGDPVTFLYASANHDPRKFDDPRRFDIRRAPNPQVSFGKGPHFCLGASLARLEIKLIFTELARRVGSVEPAGLIEYHRDAILRGVRRLPVKIRLA